jgi:phosphoglycolate phosphatase-like HAD superfamily hydrolase
MHRIGLGVAAMTWSELADLVDHERPEMLGVDVFDTCIVRDLLSDHSVEAAIGRLATVGANGGGEAPHRSTARVASEVEELLCHPVPGVATALERIRRVGTDVVFVSDTERSSATLKGILTGHGIMVDGDRLYASCEHGATKSDGDLYELIWPEATDRIWHVGNNLWADVAMAQQAGLRAFSIVTAEPTRYEMAMAARPETAGPAVAAAARAARLQILADPVGTAREKQIEIVGAGVAGQSLGAFLLWVADHCAREDIQQVWFLSRDGELPLEMAKVMPADHWAGCRLDYLHCSRWTWQLAAAVTEGLDRWLEIGTRDATAFIHNGRHRAPLVSLLGRIGLEMSDLERGHPELAALPPWRPLPTDQVPAWEHLLADPGIGRIIQARAEVRKALIEDYLLGLGMASERVVMVDVGWRGRLAWAISSVVREVTGAEPLHLHVGGHKVLWDADAEMRVERFAFDDVIRPDPITNPVTCVETLTASGRARVVGYERRGDGSVRPVLKRHVAEVDNPDRRRLWSGAIRTARRLPSRARLARLGCVDGSLAVEAREVLGLWWTQPVREEVEALSGLAFESDDDGRDVRPLVARYSPQELAVEVRNQRTWQEGSVAVSGPFMATAVSAYRTLSKVRQAVRQRTNRPGG